MAAGVGWSTLNVNCMRWMVPGPLWRLASRFRSFSAARCRIMSVEWFLLNPGASSSAMLLQKLRISIR